MYKIACVTSVLMMAASPAVAQTTQVQAPPAAAAQDVQSSDSSDARRIVCKKEESIGSRLGAKKVCMTVQEWEQSAKEHRDQTESWQRLTPTRPSG